MLTEHVAIVLIERGGRRLGALMMMRQGDKSQTDAMMLVQSAKTAIWTRRAVVAAVALIPINGLITFLIAHYA